MKKLIKNKKLIFCITLILFVSIIPIHSFCATPFKLKEFLQNEYLYYSNTITYFSNYRISHPEDFEQNYDGCHVVVVGTIQTFDDKKKIKIADAQDRTCLIDASDRDLKSKIENLSVGDKVIVYGTINMTKDLYAIDVEDIYPATGNSISVDSYLFDGSDSYKGELISNLTNDGHIQYYIPSKWKGQYVSAPLTNNGITGRQYYLNAISPQNLEYSEVFYIFYFSNETYLHSPPSNPSNGNYRDIEELIIENITDGYELNSKIVVNTVKDANGNEFDICQNSAPAKDDNTYKMEFIFKHDGNKGIVCMLYLYYPSEENYSHLADVAYVIDSMQIK